jgi:uncharacterized protein YkwD
MSRRIPVLVAGLLLAGTIGVPSATAQSAPASGDRASSLTTGQFEARLTALTNARRKKIGCGTLTTSPALTTAARTHTLRMVRTGSFSHQVPQEAGLALRIVRAGYKHWTSLAENIAWGQGSTPAVIFTLWMHSAPHRANIQNCRLHNVGYGVRYSGGAVWVTGDYGRH